LRRNSSKNTQNTEGVLNLKKRCTFTPNFKIKMLKIVSKKYLESYQKALEKDLPDSLPSGEKPALTSDAFSFYTSISSVYSSKIEGENIDLNSYLKHRFSKTQYEPDYTKKTDDLYEAYQFAKNNPLTFDNLLQAHTLLSKNLLKPINRGRIRTEIEYILNADGQIEYVAAAPNIVKNETEKLFSDINFLLKEQLSPNTVFYFAAMIHLVFLKIHPFADGNGRSSRLLEKWFLAQKLGDNAWFIPSEKYYYDHLQDYYKNVHIGVDYEALNYDRCLPFLLMLTKAFSVMKHKSDE
jgi:Fic family protein